MLDHSRVEWILGLESASRLTLHGSREREGEGTGRVVPSFPRPTGVLAKISRTKRQNFGRLEKVEKPTPASSGQIC